MKKALDSIGVTAKLLVIYLFCVVVSIGFLSAYYIASISMDTRKVANQSIRQQTNYLGDAVKSMLNAAFLVSENVAVNAQVRAYLVEERKDYESYSALRQVLKQLVTINAESVTDITLYTEADTYSEVGAVNRIRTVEELAAYDWGKQFLDCGKNICLVHSTGYDGRKEFAVVRYCYTEESMPLTVLKVNVNFERVRYLFTDEVVAGYGGGISLRLRGDTVYQTAAYEKLARGTASFSADWGGGMLLQGLELEVRVDTDALYGAMRRRVALLSGLAVAVGLATSLVILLVARSIIGRLKILRKHLAETTKGNYLAIPGNYGADEIGESIEAYNKMVDTMQQLFDDVYREGVNTARLRAEVTRAKYIALKEQIDPHYLFNVLNTIQAKAMLRGERETADIVLTVANMFRDIISWKDDRIPVEDEIERIERYMAVQKYRFDDDFSYEISCDDAALGIRIPKMIVLTFVENACKHGLSARGDVGFVRVEIRVTDATLRIEVYDNGRPLTPGEVERIEKIMVSEDDAEDSKGLNNIYARLKACYGDRVKVTVEPHSTEGNSFVITIDTVEGDRV